MQLVVFCSNSIASKADSLYNWTGLLLYVTASQHTLLYELHCTYVCTYTLKGCHVHCYNLYVCTCVCVLYSMCAVGVGG